MSLNNAETYTFEDTKLECMNASNIANIPSYIRGELAWSYLGRLAMANGSSNICQFISLLLEKNIEYCSGNYARVWSFVKLADLSFFRYASIFNTLSPFFTSNEQDRLVMIREAVRSIPLSISERLMSVLRVCPECMKYDRENGIFHYRTVHQLPFVTRCPYHGCPLLKYEGCMGNEISSPHFSQIESVEEDIKYSEFMVTMYENLDFGTDFNDTKMAIFHDLQEKFGYKSVSEMRASILHDPDYRFLTDSGGYGFGSVFMRDRIFKDLKLIIDAILKVYGNAEKFLASVLPYARKSELIFKNILGDGFSIASDFSKAELTLRCSCGQYIETTYYRAMHGLICPNCKRILHTRLKSERDSLQDHSICMDAQCGDDFMIDGVNKGIITVLHRKCGHAFTTKAFEFLVHPACPYCKNGQSAVFPNFQTDPDELLAAFYYRGLDGRRGIAIGDTFLRNIGIIECRERDAVLVFNEKYHDFVISGKVSGIPLNVVYLKGTPNYGAWLVLAYLGTLQYWFCSAHMGRVYCLMLAFWVSQNGVTEEDVLNNRESFRDHTVEEAISLLRRVKNGKSSF